MANICQQILALDARYNAYRAPNNTNFRTLYIRRRSQLLRESGKEDHRIAARKQYLKCRSQLLSQRYGVLLDQVSTRSRSIGARSGSRITLEYSDSVEGKNPSINDHKPRFNSRASDQGTYTPSESDKNVPASLPLPLSENYSFKGVHHIFDQHHEAVTSVKFANKDKSLLACSSMDGSLSICQLTPAPATVLYTLKGHGKGVTGFEWSLSNDLLLSASLDTTVRLWDAATGSCLRVVCDPVGTPVSACSFQPLNNNMVVMGNVRGLVQVVNISTGMYLKGGSSKTTSGVVCLAFDPTGRLLWVGDKKGYILSFLFDLHSGRLTKGKRILVSENNSITSLSARNWSGRECREPSLLVNCAANALFLFSITDCDGKLILKNRYTVKHRSQDLVIRSSFCPIASYRHGTCVVTGSEDMCVYFFDVERENNSCLNKLQGHSAPVLDVSFNYDESLLASSDSQGLVIVWKKEVAQNS